VSKFSATADHRITTNAGNMQMPFMHYHNSYELYYLESGCREYFVEDSLFTVYAGEFVLIPPGKLHRTGGEYGMRCLVEFTEAFLMRCFQKQTVLSLLNCFSYVKLVPGEEQQRTCRQLLKKLEEAEDEIAFGLYLGLLLKELSACSSEELKGDFVSSVVSFINKNYGTITGVAQLAEQFYVSKSHLCRVFKQAMKMTVMEYLNQVRIKNACGFLESSDQNINQIAELCGYHSASYFTNVFKKMAGKSPFQFREDLRKSN
jgi:AraC-like DNA-binding protein